MLQCLLNMPEVHFVQRKGQHDEIGLEGGGRNYPHDIARFVNISHTGERYKALRTHREVDTRLLNNRMLKYITRS